MAEGASSQRQLMDFGDVLGIWVVLDQAQFC